MNVPDGHIRMNSEQKKEEAMKATYLKRMLTALLLIATAAVMAPGSLWASGTTAGTGITNTVTVNYTVNAVPASAIVTSATFTVGTRVNMTVQRQNLTFVDVAAGATNVYLTFLISNDTNTTLDFGLVSQVATTNPYTGTTNSFVTVPTVTIYVDGNSNGVYDAGVDNQTYSTIGSDETSTVFIVAAIPAGEANGALQAFSLTAVARTAGSGGGAATNLAEGAGTYNGTDVVFADAGDANVTGDAYRDARASDRSAFRISAILVSKTATVYSDPINTAPPYRAIPQAVITYTITIDNSLGTSNATSVSISDSLGGLPVTFVTQFDDGVDTCGAGQGIVVNGTCYTNLADGGTPDASFVANTVSVSGMTVNSATVTTIKYQVTVN